MKVEKCTFEAKRYVTEEVIWRLLTC